MDIIFLLRREDGDGGTKKSFVFSGKKESTIVEYEAIGARRGKHGVEDDG
jgi:hypothetical protein